MSEKLKSLDSTWLPVIRCPGLDVSRDGRVRSWRVRGSKTKMLQTPRQLKQRKKGAYLVVGTHTSGKYTTWFVHRLVLEAFVGPCPDGMEARHINGDPENNDLSNLAWATKLENESDKETHRTSHIGSRGMRRKLTEENVLEIRRAIIAGDSFASLGRRFNVTWQSVQAIARRKSWAWL